MRHSPYRPLKPELRPARSIIYKDRQDAQSMIESLAMKLEGDLGKALLAAFDKQASSIDTDALVAAIESGDVGAVLKMLDLNRALEAFSGVQPVLQQGVYMAAAASGVVSATRITGATFRFNQLNPRLIDWLRSYDLGLIRQINDATKEGVRQYLAAGMTAGKNPKAVASEIKEIVGLTDRQAKAVANYRKELETFHLKRSANGYGLGKEIDRVNGTQVFKPGEDGLPKDGINQRRLRDFRYDGALKQAVKTGKPLSDAQINKMVAAYARKYKAFRSRTIARTEAIRATNFGVQDAWQQAIDQNAVDEDLVRKKWIVAHDERLCEECGPIPKMNPAKGVQHSKNFKTPVGPVMLPPLHPNCRCTVIYRLYEPSQLQDDEG